MLNMAHVEEEAKKRCDWWFIDHPGDDSGYQKRVVREVEHIKESYSKPFKHKTIFWAISGNWLDPRYTHEMKDPHANMRVYGIFRSKKDAIFELNNCMNPNWRKIVDPERKDILLNWNFQSSKHTNDFECHWTERCEGDLIMECTARLHTLLIGYIE